MSAVRTRLALVLLASACILPDRDIRFESGLDNENAVRIVQRAPITAQMDALCNPEDPDVDFDDTFCPQVMRTRASGLVRPTQGDFCVCPNGDQRAIEPFEIYAEDADREGDSAKDGIFGVALLDPERAVDYPWDSIAYEKYWTPGREGERIADGAEQVNDRTAPPNGRDPVGLTVFQLGATEPDIDLCNDAGRPVAPGLHTLRFMVTDRPFFRASTFFSAEEVFGADQFGVPDLAAGATYATIDYVFECRDLADDDADCACEGVD
jgi:hypothetical protein